MENHEIKSDFKQQLMKRIKKRVNIDQFLLIKCKKIKEFYRYFGSMNKSILNRSKSIFIFLI